MQCPNCGFEGEGKYCSNCGNLLGVRPGEPAGETTVPVQGSWSDRCPACGSESLSKTAEKKFFGLTSREAFTCSKCGAVFVPMNKDTFKLTQIADRSNPVWTDYGNQVLKDQEWLRIAYGGLSDAKQREVDIEYLLEQLQKGQIPQLSADIGSLILKKGERPVAAIPGVTLKEPRSVRTTYGGGGGPSFRIAKGVYIRTTGFGARSESHEEIRAIDSGTLTLTSKRLLFTGQKRTTSVKLEKIVSMEPFKDGIAVNREGKQKTEYYTGLNNAVLTVGVEGRSYEEPLSGVMFMCMVQGLINCE